MSKRLQVILSDQELDRVRDLAAERGLTVSEWVREALRHAGNRRPSGDRARKLAAVRAAARHSFPTADIDAMLEEIERGYRPT